LFDLVYRKKGRREIIKKESRGSEKMNISDSAEMMDDVFRDIFDCSREDATLMLRGCFSPLCRGMTRHHVGHLPLRVQYNVVLREMISPHHRYVWKGLGPISGHFFAAMCTDEGLLSSTGALMVEFLGVEQGKVLLESIASALGRRRHYPRKGLAVGWILDLQKAANKWYGENVSPRMSLRSNFPTLTVPVGNKVESVPSEVDSSIFQVDDVAGVFPTWERFAMRDMSYRSWFKAAPFTFDGASIPSGLI
jgi:hypothetical protein